jgi:hypothetical protein
MAPLSDAVKTSAFWSANDPLGKRNIMTEHLHGPPEAQEYTSPYLLTRTKMRRRHKSGTSRQARAGDTAWEDLASLHSFAAGFSRHAGQHFEQK